MIWAVIAGYSVVNPENMPISAGCRQGSSLLYMDPASPLFLAKTTVQDFCFKPNFNAEKKMLLGRNHAQISTEITP